MQYQRLPLSHKQNEYMAKKSPIKSFAKRQDNYTYQNQIKNQRQSTLVQKSNNCNHQTQKSILYKNAKHIKSQIIFDNQMESQKTFNINNLTLPNHQLNAFNPNIYQGQNVISNKMKFEDDRKYNAKHMEIQSKINKIQSYHQKIQSLLEIINMKPRTPSKLSQIKQSVYPSRSLTKLNTPSALQSNLRDKINKRQKSFYQVPQSKRPYQAKQTKQNKKPEYNLERFIQERKNKYMRDEKTLQQTNRKKSKEYMKSIQGEVRDIQQTIQQLNKKIKQNNQGLSFRKQINFDNLSTTSNPQSTFQQNKQKYEKQKTQQVNQRFNYQQRCNNILKSPISFKKSQLDSLTRYEGSGKPQGSAKYSNPYEASIQTSQERRFSQYERYKLRKADRKQIYQSPQRVHQKRNYKQGHENSNSLHKKTGLIYKYDK